MEQPEEQGLAQSDGIIKFVAVVLWRFLAVAPDLDAIEEMETGGI